MGFFNFFKRRNYDKSNVIINGKVIKGNSNAEVKKFNEMLAKSSSGISNIYIQSDVVVNLKATNTNDITAYLHGEAICNGIDFDITSTMDRVTISAKFDPTPIVFNGNINNVSCSNVVINGSSISIGGCISSNLVLDIEIPMKLFESIHMQTHNASIKIDNSISVNLISVSCYNGKIEIFSPFEQLDIHTHNGSIFVNSYVKTNPKINISAHNGSINVNLPNVDTSRIHTKTINGSCSNSLRINKSLNCKYIASGSITTHNGSIRIN